MVRFRPKPKMDWTVNSFSLALSINDRCLSWTGKAAEQSKVSSSACSGSSAKFVGRSTASFDKLCWMSFQPTSFCGCPYQIYQFDRCLLWLLCNCLHNYSLKRRKLTNSVNPYLYLCVFVGVKCKISILRWAMCINNRACKLVDGFFGGLRFNECKQVSACRKAVCKSSINHRKVWSRFIWGFVLLQIPLENVKTT